MKPGRVGWTLGLCTAFALGPLRAAEFTASVSAGSDYIFRSETQTNHRPALQASLEYDAPAGWYAGLFGSNVSWIRDARPAGATVRNTVEIDAWGGYRRALDAGFSWDLGIYHYAYPGTYPDHGYTLPDTSEAYAQLAWGGLSLRYWYAFSDWFALADSAGSGYAELNESYRFADAWLLNTHLGHQRVAGHDGAASFTDWKLGLAHTLPQGWLLALAYSQGNGSRAWYRNNQGVLITRAALVVTASKSFGF